MTGPPRVRFEPHGVEVEGGLLWLDARRVKPLGVVSHAHADHVARHRTILCTPETAALIRRRVGGHGRRFLEHRYGEPTPVGDLTVTLLPAGHILGSAMVLLEGPGGSLLYTGDVRPEGGLTCPPAQPVRADTLITEATFGRPEYRFPPPDETRAALVRFARETLEAHETPVLLAYALGKAQEVMTLLAGAGIPIAAHGAVWKVCDVYRSFGHAFPGSRRLTGTKDRRAAVVVPPHCAGQIAPAGPRRVAAITGWGERARGRGVDRVFPLSDHADYDGLLRLVDAVRPRRVHVVHGFARSFAATLRERGYDAEAVPGHAGPDEDAQLRLFG
ncbi:MAG: MBL fold metallo-hydrolase [Planctomycetota bacterium]|jgi:Cft2 family RNA processing exonuclease